jgi:LDH2 family malate/lactate/ureidoglycolate dehydrogenase
MSSAEASPPLARYRVDSLVGFASELFRAAGCDQDKAEIMAELLVEADLMGHTTHGLQLAPAYLEELASGAMRGSGTPHVIADKGPAVTWDGDRLPGVWLMARAVDLAVERSSKFGVATVAVRNSHHVACLAVYLERATRLKKMLVITTSDPSDASVAPFGGLKAVFTPDPIAVGIPTAGPPILIDMSASITTNGMTNRLRKEGRRFPGAWAITAQGAETDDPNALFTTPPGTLLPAGGTDHGHKGYGLALLVEASTQGLSGHGRSHHPSGWGASFFVQAMDPALYGGADAFVRETTFTAEACRSNPPAPGFSRVRVPGDHALARKAHALEHGLELYSGILEGLASAASKAGVLMPKPISTSSRVAST